MVSLAVLLAASVIAGPTTDTPPREATPGPSPVQVNRHRDAHVGQRQGEAVPSAPQESARPRPAPGPSQGSEAFQPQPLPPGVQYRLDRRH
jgi:hypothetical protein